MRTFMEGAIFATCLVVIVFCVGARGILMDIRAIESEARDALNVQNCYMMNDDEESFNSCLNDY